MSLTAFRRIQIGKESTRGTRVAADVVLVGTLTMTPMQTRHRPVDERNSLAEFKRSVLTAQGANLRFEGDATYEQIVYFLGMALKGGVSGVQQGATSAYLWTFTPTLTAKQVQDSFTFEYGDDDQEWESGFVVAQNLEIPIDLNGVLGLRADLFGQFPAKSTFTGALTEPSITEAIGGNLQVYIDGTWGAIGTTEKATLVKGGTIRLPSGLIPVRYADGSLDFSAVAENRRHFEMELEMVVSTAFLTEYDAWAAGTDRAIRLLATGGVIEGAHNYTLQVDMFGEYINEPELFTDSEGENMVRLTLGSKDDGSGNELSVVVKTTTTVL